ncbi:LysR substrate-binding domain-containing protein [Telluria beijingensis]|uniref:LysR substrate-binding domain-containing protein n=1 Tax=Telluria beijingensis TaxID=3068633 RepID=UPI0027961042|nr:LysR substrate-binding domain-containing protein [Massilia sp. REN29]
MEEARAILARLDTAVERAGRISQGVEGVLSIGFTSSAAAHQAIPALTRTYREQWPQVVLDFRERNAAELTDEVAQGKLDIAFLRRPASRPDGLTFHTLLEEDLLLVLPAGHAAIPAHAAGTLPKVPLLALRDEPFILVRRSGAPGMYGNLIEACVQAGFVPHVAIEVERMLTNISLVAAGAGVSAVPASMQGFHARRVVYCAIQDAPPTLSAPLTMVWRDDGQRPPVGHMVALARRMSMRSAWAAYAWRAWIGTLVRVGCPILRKPVRRSTINSFLPPRKPSGRSRVVRTTTTVHATALSASPICAAPAPDRAHWRNSGDPPG